MSEATARPLVRLKDAKFSELGDVPFMDYINLVFRILCVALSVVFAFVGTHSFAIGASVFFGLCAVLGAISQIKS